MTHKIKRQPLCIWCGQAMCLEQDSPRRATQEHLVPRALGGWRLIQRARERGFNVRKNNVALSCRACNNRRGSELAFATEHTPESIRTLLEGVQRYLRDGN